jgi:hypothetical protein
MLSLSSLLLSSLLSFFTCLDFCAFHSLYLSFSFIHPFFGRNS